MTEDDAPGSTAPEAAGDSEGGEPLRRSEERFRLLVEGVTDYAIFILDRGGHVSTWNAGAERIKGYRAHEIGKHFSIFYPPEAVTRGLPEHELEVVQREGRLEDEGWRLRKDGTPFWANVVVITALRDASGRHLGFSNPRVSWARDAIDRQVSHLSRLVDDLLDMSRIASGKVTLHREPLDLSALVSHVVEPTRLLLEERKHSLSLTLPDEPLRVNGDVTRLSQVVLNLLNNAAKYTPKGGRVWVTLRREDGQAILSVRDNGIGMAPDLVPRVFDLFVQGERALDRSEGGLGIGLTLVRKLVGHHGGTVDAFSAGPGQGSEFVVRLPALDRPTAAATPSAEPAAPDHWPKRRRVLVVDDNADAADTMAILLQIWGHDVHVARDGPTALAVAADRRPEVVLLDIGLPGMTGYEVAQRLREIADMADAVLVAMTGYGQDEDRRTSHEAGFALHLVKPVRPDVLQKVFADLERESDEVGA